jgi:hypothetical protein
VTGAFHGLLWRVCRNSALQPSLPRREMKERRAHCYDESMSEKFRVLTQEAERLSPAERIRLVEHVLATLDKADAELDRRRTEESEPRLNGYLHGQPPGRMRRGAGEASETVNIRFF